ncbi:MAG: hypothetical protein HY549_11420 [Elusimicrobia bacterium]|nr:hypothetical protein [Elusimicrobiota bacterium]
MADSPGAVWAQRRQAEPEANPEFQQKVQAPPLDTGSPLSEPGLGDEELPADSIGSPVQIGTTPNPRPQPEKTVPPLETRVTVRVKGAPLATFLETISAQSKINFIISEGLEAKKVTAYLQNVTVREALQVLLEMRGLTYQQVGKSNTFIVSPRSARRPTLITRIYTLAYVPLIAVGNQDILGSNPLGQSSGGGIVVSAASQTQSPSKAQEDKYSDIAIINVIRSVLSKNKEGEAGQVAVEPRTNSLIITDIPEVFPQVEQIIAELDRKSPQIMIEAQIVEIDSNRSRELGLEWGGAQGELATFTGGQRDVTFPLRLPSNLGNIRFFDPVDSVVSSIGGAGDSSSGGASEGLKIQAGVLDLTQLKVTLRALVSRSEARFLGKPKVLTLNNKPAVIQVANSQALSIQQSIGTAGQVAQASVIVERTQTGLVLKVTPQVNKEGFITMLVQPSFTDVQESAISRANARVFDPISRGASSLVRVKNGQTLVMGGLLQSTETKVVRKVPFLGYIPVIGWLFTSTSNVRKNSDLVIFITPTIISD